MKYPSYVVKGKVSLWVTPEEERTGLTYVQCGCQLVGNYFCRVCKKHYNKGVRKDVSFDEGLKLILEGQA